jgi:hypothetical protein
MTACRIGIAGSLPSGRHVVHRMGVGTTATATGHHCSTTSPLGLYHDVRRPPVTSCALTFQPLSARLTSSSKYPLDPSDEAGPQVDKRRHRAAPRGLLGDRLASQPSSPLADE